MSLLEVLSDLVDTRPKVGMVREDWERRCVIQGAEWVGEAVEKLWGGVDERGKWERECG